MSHILKLGDASASPAITSRQSWNRSGRTGQDRTKSSSGRTKPDFCRIFFDFFAGFLPDFCRIDVKNDPAGFRPDRTNFEAGRTGPDAKTPSGSNSASRSSAGEAASLNCGICDTAGFFSSLFSYIIH